MFSLLARSVRCTHYVNLTSTTSRALALRRHHATSSRLRMRPTSLQERAPSRQHPSLLLQLPPLSALPTGAPRTVNTDDTGAQGATVATVNIRCDGLTRQKPCLWGSQTVLATCESPIRCLLLAGFRYRPPGWVRAPSIAYRMSEELTK